MVKEEPPIGFKPVQRLTHESAAKVVYRLVGSDLPLLRKLQRLVVVVDQLAIFREVGRKQECVFAPDVLAYLKKDGRDEMPKRGFSNDSRSATFADEQEKRSHCNESRAARCGSEICLPPAIMQDPTP